MGWAGCPGRVDGEGDAVLTVELVRRGAARHARRTAVVSGDRSLTFGEVDTAANRIAHVLAGLGVARGARVGLLVHNGIWSIPVDFACLKAGAARVPLNVRLAAAEQARMLADTGVRLLVHGADLADRAGELASRVDGLRLASLGSTPEVDAVDLLEEMGQASEADPRVPASAGDPVLVLYTSGTTGALKAVEHTQASFAAITANILANLVSPGRDSVMLHAASLIHASGTFVLPYWIRGGCAAVLPGFDPATYLDELARHRATEINLPGLCWSRSSSYGGTGWCSTTARPRRRWPSPCWTPMTTVTRRCSVRAGIRRSMRRWR